jgi:tetratricopeptide (TPR) repeat protein
MTTNMSESTQRFPAWMMNPSDRTLCIGIFVVCLIVYANCLGNGYAYDDDVLVNFNPMIESLRNIPEIFRKGFWEQYTGQGSARYRPLFFVSLALEYALWGYHAWGYHLTNVLMHGVNSVLLFVLARRYGVGRMEAGIAAVIFAVHPVHTEAVANITGRLEVMGTLFCGLTWLVWKGKSGVTEWWRAGLAVVFFLCALLTKENFAVFPAVMLLADVLATRDRTTWGERFKGILPYAVFSLGLLAYLGLRRLSGEAYNAPVPTQFAMGKLTFLERCWTMAGASLEWYRLMIVGYPLRPIYDHFNLPTLRGPNLRSIIGLVVLGGIVVWAIISWKKRPVVTFGIGMWFILLSIVSNIIFPISVFLAERWLYFPLAGYCLVVGFALHWMARRFRVGAAQFSGETIAAGIGISLLIGYAGGTIYRNPDWNSSLSLFLRMTETDPGHPEGFYWVGTIIAAQSPKAAIPYLEQTVALAPEAVRPRFFLTRLILKTGEVAKARENFDFLATKVSMTYDKPDLYLADVHLLNAEIMVKEGRKADLEVELNKVLRLAPGSIEYRRNVGTIQLELGWVEPARTYPPGHLSFGLALLQLGRKEEARREFETALRLNSSLDAARSKLAELDHPEKSGGPR